MKTNKLLIASALLLGSLSLQAKNTTTSVKQVTESVTLTDDVDYTITDDEPFDSMGSVNIENTEHAVIIIKSLRPSQVISKWLKNHVYINGKQAVNNTNCQVRMFNRGAIILPYASSMKPLTCYTEENYGGNSYNGYTEGHDGGFMKTLSNVQLNNKIRSFKLKRGYMVTFAVGTGGWGYSRCFIADMEDLEIPVMPEPFKGTISSYRIFKWWNSAKAGGASSGDRNFNQAIKATWCYDWAQGNSTLLPDVEWVPNHIYEDWPSASACGSVDGSCHMKTNNEPANSADDHPQDVATVLGNWQNLMRTGMRLCSPATHDGGWGWHNEFMNEIDKRGWRCDLVDFHGYWDGEWGSLDWRIDTYAHGRPVWFSEWLWGASWNNNGIFKAVGNADDYSSANQQTMYNGTKPILDRLNSNARVERYAIWNGERNASKIYKDGGLSKLGQYYATMETGLAYNPANEYVPKIVCEDPGTLTGSYSKTKKVLKLDWSDPNGDLLTSMEVQRRLPGSSTWKSIATIELKDQTGRSGATYTCNDTISAPGLYTYRIMTIDPNKGKHYSNELPVTLSAANSVGTLGYGTLDIASTDEISTDFESSKDADGNNVTPAVFIGMISNKNTANGFSNHVTSIAAGSFKYRIYPWTLNAPAAVEKKETADYMLAPMGTYNFADGTHMLIEKVGSVKGEAVEVAFSTPFPEGTVPVVIIQNNSSSKTAAPVVARVFDVTNTGFKAVLTRQEGITASFNGQTVNYMAALPGCYQIGGGKLLYVLRDSENPVGGTSYVNIPLLNPATGEAPLAVNPVIIGGAQTMNYAATSCFRQQSIGTAEFTVGDQTFEGLTNIRVKRQHDETTTSKDKNTKTNGDYIGWFILADDLEATGDEPLVFNDPTAIRQLSAEAFTISTEGGMIHTNDPKAKVYNANGQQVPLDTKLPAGLYIVGGKKLIVK